ncbi:MAG: hypothetical protein LBE80_04060 [Deltaproteobacteria bacterium]|nr:hypothetical protein [Deltaproteobacteria bacterium]
MKVAKVASLVLALFVVALGLGCGSEEPPTADGPAAKGGSVIEREAPWPIGDGDHSQQAPVPEGDSPLKILQFLPNGHADKLSQIVVMFNEPMVSLGDYEADSSSSLVLEPQWEGQLKWLNQYTLAFTPKEPIFGSLTLKATIKGTIKALSGHTLGSDHSITINLPHLDAISANLGQALISYDNPLRPVWTVNFNQKVNLEALKKYAFFEDHLDSDENFKVPIDVESAYEKPTSFGYMEVRIWPKADLPVNTEYSLIVNPGPVSDAGPDPLEEPLTVFSGKTYGPLVAKIEGPSLRQNDLYQENPSNMLGLVFNNPVSKAEALAMIEFEPKVPEFDGLKKDQSISPAPGGAVTTLSMDLEEGSFGSPDESPDESPGQNPGENPAESAGDGAQKDESASKGPDEQKKPDDFVTEIFFFPKLKSNTTYKVTFKKGLKDGFGQALKSDQVISFRTGAYTPAVRFNQPSGSFERKTAPIIPITVANTPSFKVEGYSLSAAEAMDLIVMSGVNLAYGYVSQPQAGLNWLAKNKKAKVTELKPLNGAIDGPVNVGLNLANLFGSDIHGKVLVVAIPAQSYPTFTMYQISDLGLTVKIGRDSGLAWTTDLTTGLGKEGVEVELISLQGTSLWKGNSGPEGLVNLPGGNEINQIIKDLVLEPKSELGDSSLSIFVVARDKTYGQEQLTLWNMAWDEGFESYSLNLDGFLQWPLGDNIPNGYLLTSQPIYKPGETVNLKVIGRDSNGDKLVDLPKGEIKLVLADPNLEIVLETVVETSSLGTASFNYELPKQAKIGNYTVFLSKDPKAQVGPSSPHPYLYSNPNLTYYGAFTVENFRTPAFDITFEDLPKEVYLGQSLEVKAKALYHFGGPVANRPAEYSFTSEDLRYFTVQKLPGFSLVNEMTPLVGDQEEEIYHSTVTTILSGDKTLDDNGFVTFSLKLDPIKRPMPRLLKVHLGAQDVDSRSVFKAASLTAHPSSIYAALKVRKMVGQSGQPMTFDYAVTKPDGTLVKNDLKVTLYRRNYNTVRRRSNSGIYLYDSNPYDEVVQELNLTSEEGKVSEFELTPPKAGYYWIKASLMDELERANESSVSFFVSGNEPIGWYFSNDEKLTMIADKDSYEPGETAKILVQSPFKEGEALLTVERGGVKKSEVIPIYGNSPVFDIPLGPDDGPNVFVSVLLSRGRIAEAPDKNNVDLGKPAIRKGYLTLRLPNRSDILEVEVKTDAQTYKPGGEVTVDLKVLSPEGDAPGETEIALAVVDTALIQLVGDDVYYPDRIFSSDRRLSVLTVNPIVSLIGRRNLLLKGMNEAGGGELLRASAPASSVNESILRQNFKNLAFFKPDVTVAADGTAQVTFNLPDNLTTFKIYAVATGHGRLSGTGEGEFLVTKEVLLRNSLPAYASLGDEFTAAVTVTNRSDQAGKAKVSLSAENIEITTAQTEKEIDLAPNQSLEVGFPVKATSLGQTDFTFNVTMGQDSDAALYRIQVLPINPLTTQASYLELNPGDKVVDLKLPEGYDPNRGQLSLELSPSLVGLLSGPIDYLEAYPYHCLEQLTSKAYGALFTIKFQKRLSLDEAKIQEARRAIQEHISLIEQSNLGGGFALWPSITDWGARYPALAAFILEFLIDARKADFKVNNDLITSICDYLTNYINDPQAQSKGWYSQEALVSLSAYSIMALAKAGREVNSYIEVYLENKEKLPLIDLINLIRAIGYMPKFTGRGQLLMDSITLLQNHFFVTAGQTQLTEVERSPWIWSDNDKATALALLALTETAIHNEFVPGLIRNLAAKASRGSYSSTQSNVYTLMALSNYLEKTELELPKLSITALLDDKEFLQATFTSPINPSQTKTETMANLSETKALNLKTEGTGQAYAAVKLTTAPLQADLSADISSGLYLSRSYEVIRPQSDLPIQTTFERGQVVKVTVTMMTPEHRHDLVLEDKIPAGFEAINLTFLSEDQTLIPQLNQEISGWKYNDFFWYYHQEVWPDRVSVYSDYLPAGVYTFSYLVRPITIGTYQVPGPKAEEMYFPEIFGRGQGQTLTVLPSSAN